jgi:hypothetical protein
MSLGLKRGLRPEVGWNSICDQFRFSVTNSINSTTNTLFKVIQKVLEKIAENGYFEAKKSTDFDFQIIFQKRNN